MKSEMITVLRSDFLAFARKAIYETEGTKITKDRYLEFLATHLIDFADKKTRRLLINLPPRHLKTQLASISLAAWILANTPNTKIMVVAYSSDLAALIARSIRSILQADWFKETFSARIAKGHAKAMDFSTTAGGAVYAVSLDGAITGFGADVIIVDDPHNLTDAGYPDQLQRTIDRFLTVIMSRLNNRKKGRVIVIAHRIHDDDLSARLLASGKWKHVVLPMVATRDQTYQTAYGRWRRRKGELLRPDADELDEIEELRAALVNPSFDLLYQQDADEQALPSITADQFCFDRPDNLHNLPHIISIDAGTNKGDHRSFSVIQVWACDGVKYYLVDQYRARCDFHELGEMTWRFARRYRQCPILIEQAANGPALLAELTHKQRKRVHGIIPRGSKAARFRPHIEKVYERRVYVLLDEPFRSDFVREFIEFPHGRHSDQVDAYSQAMIWIDENSFDHSQNVGPPTVNPVVALNSQYCGPDPRHQSESHEPAVVSGNSTCAWNTLFRTSRPWGRY